MGCARRNSVCVLGLGFLFFAQAIALPVLGKGEKDDKSLVAPNSTSVAPVSEFQWKDHQKLSWSDFKGPVNAVSDESAAATHCGIGFKVNNIGPTGKPEVVVYNTFYVNRSWVRHDAKINTILDHEQGHFDLCEIYTRKLRSLMQQVTADPKDMKPVLMDIFASVNDEYERRQQDYEAQTTHGTDLPQQRKWQDMIRKELN